MPDEIMAAIAELGTKIDRLESKVDAMATILDKVSTDVLEHRKSTTDNFATITKFLEGSGARLRSVGGA